MITVDNLSKSFTRWRSDPATRGLWRRRIAEVIPAVQDLCFHIRRGEKVAFIGPNGAGKSTTLRILCGILHPTTGHAEIDGLVPWQQERALAQRLGIVFGQRSQLWPLLPVQDSFDLLAAIYGLAPATYHAQRDKLLALFGIADLLPQPSRSLSLGQRMRCEIVASLLHRPAVLLLDEPTIGLDVVAKALLRDHLNQLAHEDDTTIILTSHDTQDIERICDRVILIDHGQKVIDAGLNELRRDWLGQKVVRLVTAEAAPILAIPGVVAHCPAPHQLVLTVDTARSPIDRVVAVALQQLTVQDLVIAEQPLEEVVRQIYARQRGGR